MAISAADAVVSNALSTVTGAIRNAAQATGTRFNYLLATAQVESRLNPNAAAPTSSAAGLFQFIEQTWLGMIKQAGPEHGYGRYADAIQQAPNGRCYVADPAMRAEIMKLRFDPKANAAMAGAFTNDNAQYLSTRIGRAPSDGELYIAHFFGPSAACRLINMAAEEPARNGAAQFPAAARANRSIFYDRQGNNRTVSQVYSELVRRYRVALDKAMGSTGTSGAAAVIPTTAQFATVPTPTARPGAATIAPVGPASVVPPARVHALAAGEPLPATPYATVATMVPATTVHALAVAAPSETPETILESIAAAVPTPRPAQADTLFNSLYRPGPRKTAVAPVVTKLWGTPAPHDRTSQPVTSVASSTDDTPKTFDLFRDAILPNLRAMFERSA